MKKLNFRKITRGKLILRQQKYQQTKNTTPECSVSAGASETCCAPSDSSTRAIMEAQRVPECDSASACCEKKTIE